MSTDHNVSWGSEQQMETLVQHNEGVSDRSGLIGLLVLLSLAILALGIRYLFPDLNSIFLAGLGITVYGIYLGILVYISSRTQEVEPALEPVVAKVRDR
jgi:hypothetical protein